MPLCEAKCCGIPVMATEYSAMTEHCECLGTWKIKIGRGFHEDVMGTEQFRSLPDNDDAAKKLLMFFTNYDQKARESWIPILRKDAVDNFSFDRGAKIIEQAIDSLEIYNPESTWNFPQRKLLNPNFKTPEISSNGDFINYLILQVLHMPEKIGTEWRNELVKGLNVGYINYKNSRMPFDRNAAIDMIREIIAANNYWENVRYNKLGIAERALEWSLV